MIKDICEHCKQEFKATVNNFFEVTIEQCGGFSRTGLFETPIIIVLCNECIRKNGKPIRLYEGELEFDNGVVGALAKLAIERTAPTS